MTNREMIRGIPKHHRLRSPTSLSSGTIRHLVLPLDQEHLESRTRMGTEIRNWSLRHWVLLTVGLLISASVGGCFGSQDDDLSDDRPHHAADIRIKRPYNLLGERSDDVSEPVNDRIVDPQLVRLAFQTTFLKKVADHEGIARQPQIQQSKNRESYLRRHLKVTTPDANLLRIEFASGTKAERAEIANVVAEVLIREHTQLSSVEYSRQVKACESAFEDIRRKLTAWRDAEERLMKRIGPVQVDDQGTLTVFPPGLRERYGELMLERNSIDAQIAVAKEAVEADDDTMKNLAKKRRVVALELEQLKELIVNEETFNDGNSRRKAELSELQEAIRDYSTFSKTLREKLEHLKLFSNCAMRLEKFRDATPGHD